MLALEYKPETLGREDRIYSWALRMMRSGERHSVVAHVSRVLARSPSNPNDRRGVKLPEGPIVSMKGREPIALYHNPNPETVTLYHGNGVRTIDNPALLVYYPGNGEPCVMVLK